MWPIQLVFPFLISLISLTTCSIKIVKTFLQIMYKEHTLFRLCLWHYHFSHSRKFQILCLRSVLSLVTNSASAIQVHHTSNNVLSWKRSRQELKELGVCDVPHVAGSLMTTVSNVLMITNGKREMKFSLSALRNTSVFSLRGREREREHLSRLKAYV